MRKFGKILAITAALALSAPVFAACGGSQEETTKGDNATLPADGASVVSGVDQISQGVAPDGDVDYSNPDITLAADNFDGMKTFGSNMISGSYDGKVVKATGINSRSMFGAKASVMVSDGNVV